MQRKSNLFRVLSVAVLYLMFVVQGYAQQIKVQGLISDDLGPIIGASVLVQGTTQGTETNLDGKYTLSVASDAVLVVSYLGYETQIINVNGRKEINVQMVPDSKALDEVVVVGYGIQKKVNLTGSVAAVDFEEQALSRPVTNVSNALAGLSAGVQVSQGSGMPGSDGSRIVIRGIGTLNNSSPLVIIDGVEGSMDLVNPNDIQSISILKDAASSSIYGARAANGVILVTTKRGEKGKLSVNYSGRLSYAKPANLIEQVTDYADYMEWMNESFENYGQNKHFAQSTIDLWREKSKNPNELNENGVPNYVAFPNTDWQKYLFNHGLIHDHNLSVSGGTDKLRAVMSVGFLDNPGLVDRTGMRRFNMRVNLEANVTPWLTLGTRTYATQRKFGAGDFNNANNYLRQTTPGVYPEWNGEYGAPEAQEESITANSIGWFLNKVDGNRQKTNFNTNLYTSIKPIKGLSWDLSVNYKRNWYDSETWNNPLSKVRFSDGKIIQPAIQPEEMTTSFSASGSYSYTLNNILRYNTTFGEDHDFGALLGYEEHYYRYDSRNGSKKGLIDDSIHTLGSATELITLAGGTIDRARRSYFSRFNYAYKSKYLLEANVRYDGDARYHKDERWGTFPSFSAAWRISKEDFMMNSRHWLDDLKLRLSYGSIGNNGGSNVSEYEYQSTYGSAKYPFGGKLTAGLASTTLANSLLSWETSTMSNIGVDLSAFNNRFNVTVDAFLKKTTGILYRPSIYLTAGNKTAPRKNIAEMSTKGFEFTANWKDSIGEFHYSVGGNFSYSPNKVTKYKGKLVTGKDENGIWHSNIGDVSSNSGAVAQIVEDHISGEYYLREPYSGSGRGFDVDGVHGGPKDGMIRTEEDMAWFKKMLDEGYKFLPNREASKTKIWYGDYIYADLNEDGTYGGSDDRRFQGNSSTPKFYYGLQFSGAWKGFDFSMNWTGAAGHKLYWGPQTGYNTPTTRVGVAIGKDVANNHYFYDPANPTDPRTNINAKYGRLLIGEGGHQNVVASTCYLFNASYLKLKNLTVGYTLPTEISQKAKINNARLYLSIENVFNITDFPGQDPEMGAYPAYTLLRQFAFGVNISF